MEKQEDYKYSELTQAIFGCAMKVHSFLGNGIQEVIYQRALALELRNAGIAYSATFCTTIIPSRTGSITFFTLGSF